MLSWRLQLLKKINWKSWSTPHGLDSKEVKFIETIRDCFLFQYIDKPTRIRGNDEPSLIDLLLTNEELQVSDVVHHAPLGKSDHSVITFNYHCYLDSSKPIANYRKADFDSIRNNLESSDWKESYIKEGKNKDPETLWCSLKSKLLELRNQHVPIRTFKAGTCLNNKGSFPIDKSIQQAIKEKHNLHRRWIRGTVMPCCIH